MIKDARLTPGKTPSEVSGQRCVDIEEEEAVVPGDDKHPDPGLKQAAANLRPLVVEDEL